MATCGALGEIPHIKTSSKSQWYIRWSGTLHLSTQHYAHVRRLKGGVDLLMPSSECV